MKFSEFIRNGTGMRWNATSAGSFLTQASRAGSKAAQCGQAYEKNSTTSILPGTAGGTGGSILAYCVPSVGVWADALRGRAPVTREVAISVAENSRRFTWAILVVCDGRAGRSCAD